MGIRRFILWDFPRASWPYDVVVVLILAFIFLTPRSFFRDQPRAGNVVLLPSESGAVVYWIEEHLLMDVPEKERVAQAEMIVQGKTGKKTSLTRLETIFDAEKEVKGFMAFVKP